MNVIRINSNLLIKPDFVSGIEKMDSDRVRLYISGFNNPVIVKITDEIKSKLQSLGFDLDSILGYNYYRIVLDYDYNSYNVISSILDLLNNVCKEYKEMFVECIVTGEIFAFARVKFIYLKTSKEITKDKIFAMMADAVVDGDIQRIKSLIEIEETNAEDFEKAKNNSNN